jgi:hypothetical protein
MADDDSGERAMHESNGDAVDAVYVTERINGWWVSVRYESGHEVHHGPYIDEESAHIEADLVVPSQQLEADSAQA